MKEKLISAVIEHSKYIRIFLFLLIAYVALPTKAYCQEFIGLGKNEIKAKAKALGGMIDMEMISPDLISTKPAYMMSYTFPEDSINRNGIIDMRFFLRKNKCYMYLIGYMDTVYKPKLIRRFANDTAYSKRDKYDIWDDKKNGISVEFANYRQRGKVLPQFAISVYKDDGSPKLKYP